MGHNNFITRVISSVPQPKVSDKEVVDRDDDIGISGDDYESSSLCLCRRIFDMYMGARDGDWVQFGLGTASLALDVFTLGSASVVKGAVMATVKISAKTLAKTAAKAAPKSLGAGRTAVKQWLQTAGNLERAQLIKEIEGAGFNKVFDGNSMMHFDVVA